MKKILKRTLAVFLAVAMVIVAVPIADFAGLELPEFKSLLLSKAEAATISETDLFMVYPQYLNAGNATRLELKCQMDYLSAFSSCSDDDAAVAALVTSLKDGLDISLNLVTSSLGWTDTYEEKNLKDATMTLLNSAVETDIALIEAIENVEDVYKPLKKWYSASSAVEGTINKELFISESLSYFMQYTTSESVARNILEDIWKHAEKPATLKAIKKVTGVADEAFTIFQLAIQVSELYAVDLEFINIMMENLDKSSDLYEGLSLIKKDKETNAKIYVAKNYFTSKVLENIGKGLGKVFDYVTGGAYGVVNAVTGIVAYVLSNYIYEGKTATEYIQGVHLATFANDLSNSLSNLKSKFIKGTGTSEDIKTFKVLFSAYVMAMKAAAESGYNFSNEPYKTGCYAWINIMGNTYTYDAYVKACINQINADISAGKLDTSGNFTSLPSSTYENNVATRLAKVKAKYVPNNGTEYTKEFGYCRGSQGFAGHVFYMLYDIKIKPAINFNKQYEISKEDNLKQIGQIYDTAVTIDGVKNLLSKAKVGDLIVAHGKKGVHMMIVSSVGTNGVTVYDCGSIYNGTTSVNYEIREYEFSYGSFSEHFSTSRKVNFTGRDKDDITLKGGVTLYRAVNRERIDSGEGFALNYYTYDDSVNYVINNGVLTGYSGSRSVLDIPDEVTSIADNCFKNRTSITQVNLPDNLVSIGKSAFEGCTNLNTVNFNAALKSIGNRAFYNCKSLDYAMMGDKIETMGNSVFYNCSSLAAINLSSNLVIIENSSFYNCSALKKVVIPDNVTKIDSSAFQNCSGLLNVTLSKSLEIMNPNAFGYCTSLTEIEIPKSLDKAHSGSYTHGYGPFNNCENLFAVTFEEGVVEISENLFGGCSGLVSLEIPGTVTKIEKASFYGCSNLKSITIPDSVVEIGSSSFTNCSALESVVIPDNVIEIGSAAFLNCSGLSSVTLSKSLEKMEPNAFGNCTSLTEIEIPKSLDKAHGGSYTHGYGPFYNCVNLSTVTFEEGIVEISENLFGGCSGLVSIVIPGSVTRIESTSFYGCSNLKSITIPDSVVEIGSSSFTNCSALETIVVPSNVKSVGVAAFQNCSSLKTAEFKNPDTVLNSTMFYGCAKLSSVKLPKNLTEIEEYIFYNCKLLKMVDIPSTVKNIGNYAFYDCDTIDVAELPYGLTTIGCNAFYDCDALTKVVIPDSVMSLGSYAFYGCEKLSEIDFSIGIKTIPDSAFRLLPALTEVYLPRFLTTIAANAFSENTKLKEVTIPETVTSIQNNSFSYSTRLTVYGLPGSFAQTYATNKRMTFVDVSDVKVDTIKFDKSSYEFLASNAGTKFVADMTIDPKESVESVTFTSSNTSIATVENGVITVKGDGTATITATTKSGKSASCTVTVNRKATGVSLNKSKLSMQEGETVTLTATVNPANATNKNVTWRSSNENVASVSNGTVTAVAPGTATITVKTNDGDYTASCEVTVTPSAVTLDSITIKTKPDKTIYEIGESLDTSGLVLLAKYSNGSSKLVSSGFTTNGFNSLTAGTKTVTVSYGGKTTTFTVTVTVSTQPDDPVGTTYTVKWVIDGIETAQTYREGDIIVKPANPTKTGYTFEGWIDAHGDSVTIPEVMPAENLIFTAVFEEISVHTHSYTSTIVMPATCTETGVMTYTCECGDSYTESIPAKGHVSNAWEIVVSPTCSEKGQKNKKCINCSEVLETIEISATGHNAGAWETVLEPTTETEGKQVKKCTVCGLTLEEAAIAKLPKEPVRDNAVVKNPSISTISYGDSIVLHVDKSKIPEGGRVEWTASNGNFSYKADGATCTISPAKSGDTTFTATIYDADGNPVSTDEQTMTAKAGFFDKIIAFFKKLFGLTKTYPEIFGI